MGWVKEQKDWLGKSKKDVGARRAMPEEKPVLSVAEAAQLLGVSTQTIKKYLALDPEDNAPIPWEGWFRPNMGNNKGHIRIYEWAVLQLKENH